MRTKLNLNFIKQIALCFFIVLSYSHKAAAVDPITRSELSTFNDLRLTYYQAYREIILPYQLAASAIPLQGLVSLENATAEEQEQFDIAFSLMSSVLEGLAASVSFTGDSSPLNIADELVLSLIHI